MNKDSRIAVFFFVSLRQAQMMLILLLELIINISLFLSLFVSLREEDKNIFDYCRENNIGHISQAISSQNVDVNTKDEEVFVEQIHHRIVVKLGG